MAGFLFRPGQTVMTRGCLAAFEASGDDPLAFLIKHLSGDWGDVDVDDGFANDMSVLRGERILSAYTMSNGTRFWIITERDRSYSTFLLPEEY